MPVGMRVFTNGMHLLMKDRSWMQVTQMKFRLSEGNGECLYYLGALICRSIAVPDPWSAHARACTARQWTH